MSVNSYLSILLADFTTGIIGLIVSTFVIVILGEIIPQAVCNRYGLVIGATLIPLMWFFTAVFFVIAFPVSLLLTLVLGEEEGDMYTKGKMKKLFEMYEKEKLLGPSERRILVAALEISDKRAGHIMKPLDDVYMLDIDTILTRETLRDIYQAGYSRIPIYDKERDNIVGILMARELILINPEKAFISIRQLF